MPFCQNSEVLSRPNGVCHNINVCVKMAINMNIKKTIKAQTSDAQINKVIVTTTARLHFGFYDLGFYDLSSGADHMFGSLGVSLDAPETIVEVAKSQKYQIDDASGDYVANIVNNLVSAFYINRNFSVKIRQSIPSHAGLGSGTQLALAIGASLNALFDLNLSVAQIAAISQRGARSGIGIGAFEQGGFLVDAGKRLEAENTNALPSIVLPSIVLRHDFPADWRVLLVGDAGHQGVHGPAESQAFRTLQPASSNLRDMVLNHMVPALQRADLLAFGAYMNDLQAYNGAYFAPIQGGHYASVDVAAVLTWMQQNSAACVGQSSWGPTGFAILENQQQAELLCNKAELVFASKQNISFKICRGKNTGASIKLG